MLFNSLKAKLTLAFGSLIVVIFLVLGVFLVDSKARELSSDLSRSVQSYARFTAEEMVSLNQNYLQAGNFIPFTGGIQSYLRNEPAISDLSIVQYGGIVDYVSSQEQQERYSGELRTVLDKDLLERVQSNHLSVFTDRGRQVYVMVDEDANIAYVDRNENVLDPIAEHERLMNVVVPVADSYAVVYEVNYSEVDARIRVARMQIVLIAVFALALTLMIAFVFASSVTRPLNELKLGALKIAKGQFSTRVKVKSKDEVGVLAQTFNKMAKDLKASTEAMLYQERLQKELELAAKIQEGLLPDDKLELKNLDVAGGLIPAGEIGGDAFDYIPMANDRLLVYLGDVTGHGVPAGIVSSVANALLFGLSEESDLMEIADKLNKVLREKTTANVFMTMALTIWDDKKSELTYINCGHPPLFYYDAEKKKVVEMKHQGMALAFVDDIVPSLEVKRFKMKPGDMVVMYSDGVPEAAGKNGEQYGMARARRMIQDAGSDLFSAEGVKNAVLSDVVDYIGDKEHDDDITVVVLRRKKA